MEFEMKPYIVYVRVDDARYIAEVNSSAFLSDPEGWTETDRGFGDKYHHAQGNYFDRPITTDGGAYRYKLVDGVVTECTAEEIARQEAARAPEPGATLESRVETLEADAADTKEALEMILAGVTE